MINKLLAHGYPYFISKHWKHS